MMIHTFAPSAQALGMASRELPCASRAPCAGSLAASGPTKVVDCSVNSDGPSMAPTDLCQPSMWTEQPSRYSGQVSPIVRDSIMNKSENPISAPQPAVVGFLLQAWGSTSTNATARSTPERREKIERVVAGRSYSIVPVLEGLFDRGNVSAVLRSAEALGYQAVHVIELSEKFKKAKRVTQGAEKWLDLRSWDRTEDCLKHLRAAGYRILAAHVDDAQPIADIPFAEPTALFFGNEHAGLTPEVLDQADARVAVPMTGFTQTYNISVAAALALYHIHNDRTQRLGAHGDLSEDEQRCLIASYYLRCVDYAESVLQKAFRES